MCVVGGARYRPLIELHQEQSRCHKAAELDGAAPPRLPVPRQQDTHPECRTEQEDVGNQSDLVVEDVRRTQMFVVALPRLGHLQKFPRAADRAALHRHLQAVGSILCAKTAPLPRERPVEPLRLQCRVGFLRQKFPILERSLVLSYEEFLRLRPCRGTRECCAGACLGNLVVVARDASRRAHPDAILFFLQGAEKADLPVPDIDLGGHHAVRLREAQFALEIGLGIVIHVEHDGRLIAGQVFAQPGDEVSRAFERFRARNLEIHGGFGKCGKVILERKERPGHTQKQPQQQRAAIGARQMFTFRTWRRIHGNLLPCAQSRTPTLTIATWSPQVSLVPACLAAGMI